jgi:environmental stress-induced protein Ves
MAEKDSPSNLPRTESLSDTVTSNASDVGDFDINVRVQMHGILMKQPFVSSSKKWQKRCGLVVLTLCISCSACCVSLDTVCLRPYLIFVVRSVRGSKMTSLIASDTYPTFF